MMQTRVRGIMSSWIFYFQRKFFLASTSNGFTMVFKQLQKEFLDLISKIDSSNFPPQRKFLSVGKVFDDNFFDGWSNQTWVWQVTWSLDFLSTKEKSLQFQSKHVLFWVDDVMRAKCVACVFLTFSFQAHCQHASIMSLLSSRRLMLTALLQREKNKNVDSDFSTKPNANIWFNEMQAVPSILLLVTNKRRCTEDAGKKFGADAISANVAKHICVFEGKCWLFHFQFFSR